MDLIILILQYIQIIDKVYLEEVVILEQYFIDTFFFSLDFIYESPNVSKLLTKDELLKLVGENRSKYIVKHPKSILILAEFKNDIKRNQTFLSLSSLADYLKGDRATIRQYLKGEKLGYYRGVWKFSYISNDI